MISSFLIGLTAGARALTPLAIVSGAARRGMLRNNGAAAWLGHPAVAVGSKALAAGEILADKMRSAPDRIVFAGIGARLCSGAVAGAALAPRNRALSGALLGATAAVAAAYVTFGVRMSVIRRFGQTPTGIVEDALNMGLAKLVVDRAIRNRIIT